MSAFFEMITSIPTPFNMIVLIVLICSGAGVITAISNNIRSYYCHREEIELKRELVDRGMTGPEIEQVVRAKSKKADES